MVSDFSHTLFSRGSDHKQLQLSELNKNSGGYEMHMGTVFEG